MAPDLYLISSLKRLLLLLAANFILLIRVSGQKATDNQRFHMEGRIEHFGNGILVGAISDASTGRITMDTIQIENNIFNHSCHIAQKQIVSYVVSGERFSKYRKVEKDGDRVKVDFADRRLKAIEVVAFPGAEIKINGTASTILAAYPSGDIENNLLASINRQIDPFLGEMSHLDYTNKKNIRQVLQQEEKLVDSIAQIENRCIRQYPGSMVASYITVNKFQQFSKNDPEKADSLLRLLRPESNDIYFQQMVSLQQNRSKKVTLHIGDVFPNFTSQHTYDGTRFNLNNTTGKYRLIDFWGTWCIPCVSEMPELKDFSEKHKAKLVVIGIARDTYERWKTFLDKKSYNWIQLIDLAPDKLSDKLNIEVYPTKFLVDPNGKILLIIKDADKNIWDRMENMIQD